MFLNYRVKLFVNMNIRHVCYPIMFNVSEPNIVSSGLKLTMARLFPVCPDN